MMVKNAHILLMQETKGMNSSDGQNPQSGKQYRKKYVAVNGQNGGDETCKTMIEERDCNTETCKIHCRGEWSGWQDQDLECVRASGPSASRQNKCEYKCKGEWQYYTITKNAEGGGNPCPHENDAEESNTDTGWRDDHWSYTGLPAGGSNCPAPVIPIPPANTGNETVDTAVNTVIQIFSPPPSPPSGGCVVQ